MSCSISERKKQDVQEATGLFMGNSTRFKSRKPGEIEMTIDEKFTSKNQLFNIAKANAKKVEAWALDRYGKKFSSGWVHIDQTLMDTVTARINMPSILHQALLVHEGSKSIDEVNMDPALFDDVGNDYYMGDNLLREQDKMESDNDFYSTLDGTISNLEAAPVKNDVDLFSNTPTEWEHDTSKDKDVEISDNILNRIINNEKGCK